MRILLPIAALAFACSTPPPKDPGHSQSLSVHEHEQEAQRHEREAAGYQAQAVANPEENKPATKRTCYDQPLAPNPTSGTEQIRVMRPCWTALTSPSAHHRKMSAMHLRAAREHRDDAAELMSIEKGACVGLGEREVSRSPFFYRDDIKQVAPYREGGVVRGVRVLFRPVEGLTVEWMRRSMTCHQARAAVMGYSTTYMKYCPLMLGKLSVSVEETRAGIAVTMRSTDSVVANAALGRAKDLAGGE